MIIPLHTTPEMAVREIDELYDVYLNVRQRWTSEVSRCYRGMFVLSLNEVLKSGAIRSYKVDVTIGRYCNNNNMPSS